MRQSTVILEKIVIFIEKWQDTLFNTPMKNFGAKYFPQSHFCNKIAAFLPSKQYSRQNSGNLS